MDTTSFDTPEKLARLRLAYWPAGSGPLGPMRTVVALINDLARVRGWASG